MTNVIEIVRERVPEMRAREQKAEAAWLAFTKAWERRFGKPYPMARFMALALAGIWTVAMVAELKLMGAW